LVWDRYAAPQVKVMWQGAILNFLSVLKYSLILFVIQTAVSTASTILNGVDNLASQSPSNLLMYQYIPTIPVMALTKWPHNKSSNTDAASRPDS